MNAILRYGFALLAIGGIMSANPALALANKVTAPTPAQLIILDNAKMFSDSAKEKAKSIVAGSMGEGNRQVHIETYTALSATEMTEFAAIGKDGDHTAFWKKWAEQKETGDRGVVILVNRHPGHVHVVADKQFREKKFGSDQEKKIKNMLLSGFEEAAKGGKTEAEQLAIRDAALISVAEYLKASLPASVDNPIVHHNGGAALNPDASRAPKAGGSNIGSYICIGLAILLGVWLIFGLIRAFTGGGGGGGGMGGGGMGGGGGGGFMTGLLGGLFGAMAGNWLYNNMFGGGMSSAYGSGTDNYGGDNFSGDTGGGEADGAGDFSGDSGSGGDFDGGSGGDAGGGGDWGGGGDSGGGDWGGGGGDFGGGGGDF